MKVVLSKGSSPLFYPKLCKAKEKHVHMNNTNVMKYCQISRSLYNFIENGALSLEEIGYFIAVKSLNLINGATKTTSLSNLCRAFNVSKPTLIKYNRRLIEKGLMDEETKTTIDPEGVGYNGFVKVSNGILVELLSKKIKLAHVGYMFCLSNGIEYGSNISNASIRGVARYGGFSKTTSRKYSTHLIKNNLLSHRKSGLKISLVCFGVNTGKEFDPLTGKEFDPLYTMYKKEIKRERQKYHVSPIKTSVKVDVDDFFINSDIKSEQLTKTQLKAVSFISQKYGEEKTKSAMATIFKSYELNEVNNLPGLVVSYMGRSSEWGMKPSKNKIMTNINRIECNKREVAATLSREFMRKEIDRENKDKIKYAHSVSEVCILKSMSHLDYSRCQELMRVNFPNFKESSMMYKAQIGIFAGQIKRKVA